MFQVPPFELLISQLRFGKRTSLRLKEYKWSAYGFNPYGGGVDRLGRLLETKKYRFYYDVSGWDKFLPVMSDLYTVIRACNGYLTEWTDAERLEFDWMVENTVNHNIKMPDGSVYLKTYGNPSGSGCTTRDNILAHVIIIAYALYKAYQARYGVMPSPMLVSTQVVKLFGDDSVIGVDSHFKLACDKDFMSNIFSEFGMKLKFFFGGKHYPVEKMEFLGFKFHKIINDGPYYPRYDVVRLASSMLFEDRDRLDRTSHLSKCFVLTLMSYPTDYHQLFLEAYKNLLLEVSKHPTNETERAFMSLGPFRRSISDSLFLGLEAGNDVWDYFLSQAVEEQKDLLQNVEHFYNNHNSQKDAYQAEGGEASSGTYGA